MRIFIDTNVILSTALFPCGVAASAYRKAVSPPHDPLISDYVISELQEVFSGKFPERIDALDAFLSRLGPTMTIVPTPHNPVANETALRDMDNGPILRAAIAYGADVILTGDKDLLEANLKHPQALSPSAFINLD